MPRPCKVCGGMISDHDCCMNTREGEALHPGCWPGNPPIPADHNCDVAGCSSVAHNEEKSPPNLPFDADPINLSNWEDIAQRLVIVEKEIERLWVITEKQNELLRTIARRMNDIVEEVK